MKTNEDFNLTDDFDDISLDLELEMDDDFDLSLNKQDKKEKTKLARVKRHKPPRTVKYEKALDLINDIGDIEEDEAVFAIVSGNFIAGDVIEACLNKNDMFAEEIIISTLSYSQENIDSLKNIWLQDRVDKMALIVSDYFFSHERANGIQYTIDELGEYDFTLAVAGLHTKIALVKTKCGKHIVIHGSANLRSSRCVEQLIFENNELLYNFNRDWMLGLVDKYSATHKALRGGKLWQVVAVEAKG